MHTGATETHTHAHANTQGRKQVSKKERNVGRRLERKEKKEGKEGGKERK